MGLFQRLCAVAFGDCKCQIVASSFNESFDMSVNREMVTKACRELEIPPERIKIFAADTFDEGDERGKQAWSDGSIRGVFFMKDGVYTILLNPRSANHNTTLHELKHVEQAHYHKIRPEKWLEANAQRWADSREADYVGILRRM